MNRVALFADPGPLPQWEAAARRFILAALDRLGLDRWELSVLFCGDAYIRKLNAQFRGRDEATDVLSFALGETVEENGDGRRSSYLERRSSYLERRGSALGRRSSYLERRSSAQGRKVSYHGRRSSGLGRRGSALGRRRSYLERSGSGLERYLPGDIVISLETLAENARYFQVSPEEELRRLLMHGILHLKGMDHATNADIEPMLQLQEQLLADLAAERIPLPEEELPL